MASKVIPQGRSDYTPGKARVGDATPQSAPDAFSSEDILAEVKYLLALNRRYGSNTLRTLAYSRLLKVLKARKDGSR